MMVSENMRIFLEYERKPNVLLRMPMNYIIIIFYNVYFENIFILVDTCTIYIVLKPYS